jgi:tRNA dimethylallyltransferase
VGAEIVSVDSMQVYRGMDIGTAKPTPADRARAPHHLVDIAEPEDVFTVAQFQAVGVAVLDRLADSDVPALVVGGSGLHFRALVDPLRFPGTDPAVRARFEALAAADAAAALVGLDDGAGDHVDLENPRRVVRALEVHALTGETPSGRAAGPEGRAVREYRSRVPVTVAGFDPGETLPDRVALRLERMLAAGFLDEVASLQGRLGPTAAQAAGYRQLLPVVSGDRSLEQGVRRALDATTSLAHRQRVFFRRDPRITWTGWHDEASERAVAALRVFREAGWTS